MAEQKNQHFVPQAYFRLFSHDGRSICALLRKSGKVVLKAPIRGQASKPWFYGPAAAEKALNELEGRCNATVQELSAAGTLSALSDEQLEWLLVHLALQRSRTQAAREAGQPFRDKLAQLFVEAAVSNNEEVTEEERAALLDNLSGVTADPVPAQGLEMTVAMQESRTLGDLAPIILENRTNRPFIFGDAPVIFHNARYFDVKLRGVLGMASPGLMVIMPLSSRKCFMLVDPDTYTVKAPARDNVIAVRHLNDVAMLNKLQVHAAAECVYFEDSKFSSYVQALWQDERSRLTKHAGMVIQAPGYEIGSGTSMGEVVHGFQPQLDFRASFSFLRHEVSGDSDARPYRRAAWQ